MISTNRIKKYRHAPYIEPTIRLIVGIIITTLVVLLYINEDHQTLWLGAMLFVSLNLFQSAISKWCLMEKILKKLGFRSEIDEIRKLGDEARKTAAEHMSYTATLSLLNEAVIELSEDGILLSASDGWGNLLGDDTDYTSTIGKPLSTFLNVNDIHRITEMLTNISGADLSVHTIRFRLADFNQTEKWVGGKFMLAWPKPGENSLRIKGVLQDITEAYHQEERIKHLALHDALTGLPNRLLLEDHMQLALAHAKRYGSRAGILFIDVDNFKQINDTYGHRTGDNLLISISKIMKEHIRSDDTLARWGGDEFVILLPDLKQKDDIEQVAKKLFHEINQRLHTHSTHNITTVSIGAALYPDDANTTESLLVQADKALYHAKAQGRNNIQIFSAMSKLDAGFNDFDITKQLSAAIKENRIQVHYQLIVDAISQQPTGFEALARWHDKNHGWISPGIFIPIAENHGFIRQLSQQVMEQAFTDFKELSAAYPGICMSINLSNRQLMATGFQQQLLALLNSNNIKPENIKLEVTESLMLDGANMAKEVLDELWNAGFTISIDDFGTGYSSLSYLHQFPSHELKIDMSFVKRFKTRDGKILLETITNMGKALGLSIVAEGIETSECAELLKQLGVDRLQGYYFSKPLPLNDCLDLLQDHHAHRYVG